MGALFREDLIADGSGNRFTEEDRNEAVIRTTASAITAGAVEQTVIACRRTSNASEPPRCAASALVLERKVGWLVEEVCLDTAEENMFN